MIALETLIRKNIKALTPYSSARDEFQGDTSNMVFLDANENPYNNGVNRYPDPMQKALKLKISKLKHIPENQILLGNGSDEVLDLIFRVFCEPNIDNIIVLPPTYGMYEVLANVNAIAIKRVNLNAEFQPDVDSILQSVNVNTKLLFICSPNNPTGNSIAVSAIETLVSKFNGIVIIDEAYIDFSSSKSWLDKLDSFPNLIIIQTLSKAYGMAGIRLGICFASKAIIAVLNTVKPPYNINTLTQTKALELLAQNKVQKDIEHILKARNLLIKALSGINYISKIYPSDANFVLIKVDDATKRYNQLIQNGIVIRNRTTQAGCENTLRLTIGTTEENEKLVATLIKISNI